MKNKIVNLLGVPLDLGAENLGVDLGANAFRYMNIVGKLKESGLKINDLGNINCRSRFDLKVGNPKLKYLDEIIRVSEEVSKKTTNILKKDEKIIVLGGDHSVCLGAVSGASVR